MTERRGIQRAEQSREGGQLRAKRAAVVVFSHYPSDPRPRRAAELLAREGMNVEVICLKSSDQEPSRQTFNGVEILRLPLERRRGGKLAYLWQYASFVLASLFVLAGRSLRRRYDLVHVHNMPDVLVFSALAPKLRGAKVLLDLHDPMPELMMTIFGLERHSLGVRLLDRLEKWSLAFAHEALTVNLACQRIFSRRSCPAEKVHVIMNSPDETLFQFRPPPPPQDLPAQGRRPFVLMYHGSLVERHGLDLAVEALEKVRRSHPNCELRVFGQRTPFLEQVLRSVQGTASEPAIRYLGPRKLEGIVQEIQECDLGIIPNRRSIFTELNTPTRIFEYLSQGKPVLAPLAPGIQDYFGEGELLFFNLGDAEDLARQILFAIEHPVEMTAIVQRGQVIYQTHVWSQESARFLRLVETLLLDVPKPNGESQINGYPSMEARHDRSRSPLS
jgi:glycosyltransferase involved in cell wall biosynthesis